MAYNWLLMSSCVMLNALIEINAYHYAHAHAYTHKYTYLQVQLCCFTAVSVMSISLLLVYFLWMRHICHHRNSCKLLFSTPQEGAGNWLSLIWPLCSICKAGTPMGAYALTENCLSVPRWARHRLLFCWRGLMQRWEYSLFPLCFDIMFWTSHREQ